MNARNAVRLVARRGCMLLALALPACGGDSAPANGGNNGPPQPTVSFALDVLPLFQQECITCHGGAGGLELDSYAGIAAGGNSGAAFVPFDPANSLIIQRLDGTVPPQMPLNAPALPGPEIARIAQWILEGALDN